MERQRELFDSSVEWSHVQILGMKIQHVKQNKHKMIVMSIAFSIKFLLILKLLGPAAGVSGSLTVTIA